MKLHATIGDYESDVDIRIEGQRVFAVLNDRTYAIELEKTAEGRLLLRDEGRVYDCRAEGHIKSGSPLQVTVGTERYAITLADPKRLLSAGAAGVQAGGAARILAPMPGKVVR